MVGDSYFHFPHPSHKLNIPESLPTTAAGDHSYLQIFLPCVERLNPCSRGHNVGFLLLPLWSTSMKHWWLAPCRRALASLNHGSRTTGLAEPQDGELVVALLGYTGESMLVINYLVEFVISGSYFLIVISGSGSLVVHTD